MTVADAHDLIQTTLLGEAAENAPLGILVADDEMSYVAVNRCTCELLGYTREEMLSMRVSDIATEPESRERYFEMMREGTLRGTGRIQRKDGTKLDIEYWAYATRVAQMTVYVAFLRPLDGPA